MSVIIPKITKKLLMDEYDKLYEEACKLIAELNPCHIKKVFTPSHENSETMVETNKATCNGKCTPSTHLCCGGFGLIPPCKHLRVGHGCTVKSLKCKLWFCHDVRGPNDPTIVFHMYDSVDGKHLGCTDSPVYNDRHLALIMRMRFWKFDLLFREGKVKAVNAAYKALKEDFERCIIKTKPNNKLKVANRLKELSSEIH